MPRLFLVLLLLFPASAQADLVISEAWIKNLPVSVPVRAGYMTMHNPLNRALTIVGVSSADFASVEIHRSFSQDGMMRMEAVPRLDIEPGATLQLAPGGLHLMMMQPAQPTRPGERYEITIEYGDGARQRLQMTVRK